MMSKVFSLFILLVLTITSPAFAQTKSLQGDTLSVNSSSTLAENSTPFHRNVIKFNPTPMLLWNNVGNLTFSYERLFHNNMSFSVQVGYLVLPKLITDTIAGIVKITGGKKQGINLGGDYRYYPLARNRRPAPDGLYLGGYASYYGFKFNNDVDILVTDIDQNGSIYGRLNVLNLGANVGYQFIFWKRLSVDLLMFGPSISMYNTTLGINGNLDPNQIEDIDQEIVNELLDKYPWLADLFNPNSLEFTGTRTKLSMGLRFSIQFGFHF